MAHIIKITLYSGKIIPEQQAANFLFDPSYVKEKYCGILNL
jgi:hypothetical protein